MKTIGFQSVMQTESTGSQGVLGENYQTPDGRVWTYVKANEALVRGHVVVPTAVVGVDTVSSSADADGNIIYITETSAGWTVGQFADAWLVVDDGTGEGQVAKIKTNTADTLTLYTEWALGTALSVSDSDITIAYGDTSVEKAAVTVTNQNAIGVAQTAFAANDYGWVLSRGYGKVLAGAVITAGKNFTTGDDTEGQVILGVTAEGSFDAQTVGFSVAANTTVDLGILGDVCLA